MPLSPITTKKKKPESTMPNNTSSHVIPDEFAELLWPNGPMMTQGQTKQPWNWKSSFPTPFPAFNARAQNRRSKDVASSPKIMGNHFPSLGHSDDTGLNARDDDDTVPWISQNPHPVQDCLQNNNDFFSDFLNDFSLPDAPAGIISSGQSVRDAHTIMEQGHNNASEPPGRVRTTQLFRLPKQCQISVPNTRSEETCIGVGSGSKAHQHSGADSIPSSSQKPPTVGTTTSVINFSHFSRLAAVARANLESCDRLRSNDKASTATSTNTKESTQVIESAGGLNINTVSGASVPFRKNSTHSHNAANNHRSAPDDSSSFRASPVPRRIHQAAVASSSVCSGTDLKHGEKRKHCQGDDSGHHGEDLEDDWVGCKKPPTQMKGTGAKRSRAAQVHNLSERKRRDRINEKMRALQELIPNSNKTDKASMLDEAIEYLKTLQSQLQMMSLGSGLCMPPMMMQHMRPPTMAHYSPMGLEMGMYEMNGSPGCCPVMIPLPPMQGPHFSPCPSIPGMQGLHRMPGTPNLQMYGIPAQGFHPLLPRQQPPAASLPGVASLSGLSN